MKDTDSLQPLLDYLRPGNSDLLVLLLGSGLLAVVVFMSGEEFPPILIYFMLAAALFAILGHFFQRRGGNRAVLEAAGMYGTKELAEDFRAARSYACDQVRLGRMMLYSRFCQDLWALRNLSSVRFTKTKDSDGDDCLEIWCVQSSGSIVRICYSTNTADEKQLLNVCDLINQRIAEVHQSRP